MNEIRNLINITDFTMEEIDHLIEIADDIMANPEKYQDICAHKKLATLFFEPSTRTRLSFTAAMMELGGMFSDLTMQAPAPRRKVKASATRLSWQDAMQTLSQCVTRKKVPL